MREGEQRCHLVFFETVIGDYSVGYFMNIANESLMIGTYICGLTVRYSCTIYCEPGIIIIMGWYSQQSDKGPHLVKDNA